MSLKRSKVLLDAIHEAKAMFQSSPGLSTGRNGGILNSLMQRHSRTFARSDMVLTICAGDRTVVFSVNRDFAGKSWVRGSARVCGTAWGPRGSHGR